MHPNENVVDVNYYVQVKQKESGKVSEFNETHKMRYLFRKYYNCVIRCLL